MYVLPITFIRDQLYVRTRKNSLRAVFFKIFKMDMFTTLNSTNYTIA